MSRHDATNQSAPSISGGKRMLNVGCGRRYDRRWTNVDLESRDAMVREWDILLGLPFEDNSQDVVYHSHVLEHLRPVDGERLIAECVRVLSPGGILRIVVPDLEKIAQLYLEMHGRAWSGDKAAPIDYKWMKMELLDQLVRSRSGGQMGPYMASKEIENSDFVRSRVGDEFSICQDSEPIEKERRVSLVNRLRKKTLGFRTKMAKRMVRRLLGRKAERAFTESMFREQGEIHRWMYDRFSLKQMCDRLGLENFRVCSAFESDIENYDSYQLDVFEGTIRKPDSLFVECVKPNSIGTEQPAPLVKLAGVA